MLLMVIERFHDANPAPVGERFRARGRQIPADSGVEFIASWMARDGSHCYQLMEAPRRESLDPWLANWSDLVDFEVIEVATGADFWASRIATSDRRSS